jgi:transposase IS116/IS110/IS902 family protein
LGNLSAFSPPRKTANLLIRGPGVGRVRLKIADLCLNLTMPTDVPGISAVTAHTILSEIGTDLSQFRNASAFASWLGLCPEKQISGGKVLYVRTRAVKNRVALALRLAAHSLHHANNSLGEFFRRMRRKLGPAQAIGDCPQTRQNHLSFAPDARTIRRSVFQKHDADTPCGPKTRSA